MSRIAVVTGANQGIGFALAEGLAQRLAPDDVVYLTGRRPDRVRAAVARVARARAQVRGEVLDVDDGGQVTAFAGAIAARHGGVDIVFSNAAERLTRAAGPELVERFVETNNLGTTRVLRAFDPILRPGGRLLVVASDAGSLRQLPAHLHERFDRDSLCLDDLDATMLAWRDAVLEGRAAEEGWPAGINVPSKVGQVAAVRVCARDRRDAGTAGGTLVAAFSPGLTDSGAARAVFDDLDDAQTPAEAAVAPLRLALDAAPDERFHGELVQFGNVIPWR